MRALIGITMVAMLAGACASSSQTTQGTPVAQNSANAAQTADTAPDSAKAIRHLQKHVQFPADKASILAACAQTEEFSAGEKHWFETNLPDGTYSSAEEVISALGLSS